MKIHLDFYIYFQVSYDVLKVHDKTRKCFFKGSIQMITWPQKAKPEEKKV